MNKEEIGKKDWEIMNTLTPSDTFIDEIITKYTDNLSIRAVLKDFWYIEGKNILKSSLQEQRQSILEEIEKNKKSLLSDMAYQGADYPKNYIKFQRKKELHYNSYNQALEDIKQLLK